MKEKSIGRGIIEIMEEKSIPRNHEGDIIGRGIIEIMEKKSMTKNHEGEIIGRGIIDKGSLREASGRHLGGIWEAPGDSQMLQEAPGGSRRPWKQKVMPLTTKMHKVPFKFKFHEAFLRVGLTK